jgi:hypothetical protein
MVVGKPKTVRKELMLLMGIDSLPQSLITSRTEVAQDVRVSALELQAETLEKYGAGFVVDNGILYLEQEV